MYVNKIEFGHKGPTRVEQEYFPNDNDSLFPIEEEQPDNIGDGSASKFIVSIGR